MTISAWRIFKKRHKAAGGEGARRFGGRWNSKGVAVVYTSQTASLAALEMLVHLHAHEILSAYLLAEVSFDESLVEEVSISKLPVNWRKDPAPLALQAIGDQWVAQGSSAVLRVPSVLVDTEWNYLFNPNHPDFAKCKFGKPRPFRFDSRLVK